MNKLQRVFALLLLAAGGEANGDSLPEILSSNDPAHYLPDFSYAGYRNSNEPLPATAGIVVSVSDFGAIPDDGRDDTKAILAAIEVGNRIPESVIIRFEPGEYRITQIVRIERSNIVLQGAGAGPAGTTLFFPRPLDQVDNSSSLDELRKYIVDLDKRQQEPDINLDEFFSEYSWSGGFIWIQKPGTRPAPYLDAYDAEIQVLADVQSGTRGSRQLSVADSTRLKV
ncbi:MAG: hypothetical protein OEM25_09225, partial [Gammaproteobacteria bacterium]|nr:hypothetical protein [Gammaproteobacteria bacterium]